ncbi:MAG: 2-C-methyl-D-erythritol 4-phosphate cytidylyltransferase [Planctomycetota bacterium]|nr:2-C-methyl-D-erythritol 4-phosphate cytidylyltransferase [Planctomycetota bacterium]
MQDAFATLVLVAAGRSSRMGASATSKVLLPLAGKTLLAHTLEAFATAQTVHDLVLVARPEDFDALGAVVDSVGLPLRGMVAGGQERFHSVRAGCLAADSNRDVLLIHDAARPLVRSEHIDQVALAAQSSGAALLALPVTDSLHRSLDGVHAVEPVDRSPLWAAQTPQGFRTQAFLDTLERAAELSPPPTDDVALYEQFAGPVTLVQGVSENIKVTRPEDLPIAEALLRARDNA